VEFANGTGAVTDDTQMALFTAEGILRAYVRGHEKGICDPATVVQHAYMRWLKTQGYTLNLRDDILNSGWLIKEKQLFAIRAPGMTCLSSLEQNTTRAANNSKGCGTVMRMAPVGLFFDPETAYEYGCKFSAITHGHRTGITAGGAFAMLISCLRHGKSLDTSLDLVEKHLESNRDASETLEAIRNARTVDDISDLGEGWVAEEALAIGIYCALRYQWDFEAGVLAAVNITGDSDSTGAIAGHILGILNGENAIPEEWRKNLREYGIVSQVADDLHTKFEENEAGHVTENWWEKYPGY
jgi:ADP-ribosylglycohydrolase